MTITTNDDREEFTATGGQTIFTYTFKIYADTDLNVYQTAAGAAFDDTADLITAYSVAGVGESAGGTITLNTGATTGDRITIVSDIPDDRTTDYSTSADFLPATVNDREDRAISLIKKALGLANRSPKYPESAQGVAGLTLPFPVAGQFWRVKSDLSGLEGFAPATTNDLVSATSVATITALLARDPADYATDDHAFVAADGTGGIMKVVAGAIADSGIGVQFSDPTWNAAGKHWERVYTGPVEAKWFGAAGDGVTIDTTAFTNAAATGEDVLITDGTYQLDDEILLNSNQSVFLSAAVRINQTTVDKNIFKAISKDNVHIFCNGGQLWGEGTYSNAWTGNSGHEDRAVQFLGCTNSSIHNPVIKNCGHSGIVIAGGTGIKIVNPLIEGTHTHGTPIISGDNFQIGIYLKHDATYGDLDDIHVMAPDISGVTQGILQETYSTFTGDGLTTVISAPVIHDVPGQHGMYLQSGGIVVAAPRIDNCALSAIKLQSNLGVTNAHILKGYTITGANLSNTGSQAIEIAVPAGVAFLEDIKIDAVIHDCNRGLALADRTRHVQASIVCDDIEQMALLIQGDEMHDINVNVDARNCGRNGVEISSTNTTGLKITPRIREANDSAGAFSGLKILSSCTSTDIQIHNPDITDANTNMDYAIFNESTTAKFGVYGRAKLTGYATNAVRTGTETNAFPTDVEFTDIQGAFHNITLISGKERILYGIQTTSASSATLWAKTLADESGYAVEATITGKLAGSAERRATKIAATFYRDGAGATQQGTTTAIYNNASGTFAGAVAFDVSGNDARIRVNSGGVANYDWIASVTVIELAD